MPHATCQRTTCVHTRAPVCLQIMLKGFNYIGGIPEHLIRRAHLDVSEWVGKLA